VTNALPGHKVVSAYDVTSAFPLYLDDAGERRPNVAPVLKNHLAELFGEAPEPGEVLAYVYGVLHAPGYRSRFGKLLARELPRIPFPRHRSYFRQLAVCGQELLTAHLGGSGDRETGVHSLRGDPELPLGRIEYDAEEESIRLHPAGLRLDGVSADLWSYRIGDHAVLASWLTARTGRPLRTEERSELRGLMAGLRRSLDLLPALEGAFRAAVEA
jgi:Type ISP C-terminal specificity domain